MNAKHFLASILLTSLAALSVSPVHAKANTQTAATLPKQQATGRAEVLADLQIYRESGLARTEQPEVFGQDDAALAKARAQYVQLRSSSYYATLVKRYGGDVNQMDVASIR